MGHSGSLPSVRRASLTEDKQQTAQQSLSQILGAQAAGQPAQQGQEVLAGQAGSGQQQADQQRAEQQWEQRSRHGWRLARRSRLQALLSVPFSPGKDMRRWAGVDSRFSLYPPAPRSQFMCRFSFLEALSLGRVSGARGFSSQHRWR